MFLQKWHLGSPLKKPIFFQIFQLMIEDPWQEGKETLLPLYFRPPFTTTAKMQTALTKKFLQFSLQANYDEPTFQAGNPTVQSQTNFRLINPKDEVLVSELIQSKCILL